MIRLTVDNSLCTIQGLDAKQFGEVREILSYEVSAQSSYFSGSHRSRKRYLLDKRGSFPTGLLYLVEGYLEISRLSYREDDRRRRPAPRQDLYRISMEHEPYPEQMEAAEACLRHGRGIIAAPTGVGKSVIAALIIHKLQVPTLIVVPSLELKRQLSATLSATFGTGMVGPLGPITVENVDALNVDKVAKNYDCVIIDEFHHSGAETYRKLNKKAWTGVYYKFGLTATPFRSKDDERLLLESVLSQVIYRINYHVAVERGYIVPMEVYYYDLPKQEMAGNENNWASVYSELVVNNKIRNRLIAQLMLLLRSHGAPTLCLVKEIKHGEALEKSIGVGFANGQREDTRQLILEFNLRERKALIGTTGVLGEGVDTRPAEFIILAAGGKSKNAFMQQCGRGFRRYPGKETCKVILFRDPSHKWLLQHFNACVKYLREEYGVKPVRLDPPEETL